VTRLTWPTPPSSSLPSLLLLLLPFPSLCFFLLISLRYIFLSASHIFSPTLLLYRVPSFSPSLFFFCYVLPIIHSLSLPLFSSVLPIFIPHFQPFPNFLLLFLFSFPCLFLHFLTSFCFSYLSSHLPLNLFFIPIFLSHFLPCFIFFRSSYLPFFFLLLLCWLEMSRFL
jgi:hypothetical protein